jgi:hypothetical protein
MEHHKKKFISAFTTGGTDEKLKRSVRKRDSDRLSDRTLV